MALNAPFCHQHIIKKVVKINICLMFYVIFHLVPLVHGEL